MRKLLVLVLLLLLTGCQAVPKQPAKTVVKRDYNKTWKVLAPYIMQHFDTGNLTVEEVAAELSYQHYLLTIEKE